MATETANVPAEPASTIEAVQIEVNDPWNWRFPKRDDCMALSSINEAKDQVRVKTSQGIRSKRTENMSLFTGDIERKFKLL